MNVSDDAAKYSFLLPNRTASYLKLHSMQATAKLAMQHESFVCGQ
jgi:hypothetical protein